MPTEMRWNKLTRQQNMSLQEFLSLTPLLFIALATIAGTISVNKTSPAYLKVFAVFLWLMLSVEVTGNIIALKGINNQWLYNSFIIVMYLVIPYVYYYLLRNELLRKLILFYFFAFSVFVIINTVKWQPFAQFQTNHVVFGGSFIFLLAAAYFWQLYQADDTKRITRDTGFWFSIGLLLYYGVHVPMLGMLNYLWEHYPKFITNYFIVVASIFSILLNLCFAIGYLCRRTIRR